MLAKNGWGVISKESHKVNLKENFIICSNAQFDTYTTLETNHIQANKSFCYFMVRPQEGCF